MEIYVHTSIFQVFFFFFDKLAAHTGTCKATSKLSVTSSSRVRQSQAGWVWASETFATVLHDHMSCVSIQTAKLSLFTLTYFTVVRQVKDFKIGIWLQLINASSAALRKPLFFFNTAKFSDNISKQPCERLAWHSKSDHRVLIVTESWPLVCYLLSVLSVLEYVHHLSCLQEHTGPSSLRLSILEGVVKKLWYAHEKSQLSLERQICAFKFSWFSCCIISSRLETATSRELITHHTHCNKNNMQIYSMLWHAVYIITTFWNYCRWYCVFWRRIKY